MRAGMPQRSTSSTCTGWPSSREDEISSPNIRQSVPQLSICCVTASQHSLDDEISEMAGSICLLEGEWVDRENVTD